MLKLAIIASALVLFVLSSVSAKNWQIVYETNFSSDPVWITEDSCSSRYYWDSISQTYFTDNYTNSGAIRGCWAVTDTGVINYGGESFKLAFDVKVERLDGETGDVCIGLFGPDRESHSGTEERIFVLMGGFNHEIYLEGHNSGGDAIQSPAASGLLLDSVMHQVEITFDSLLKNVSLVVTRNDTTILSWDTTMNFGFSDSLLYLGVSMKGSWSSGGRHGTANIDNVSLSYEVTDSLLIPPVSVLPCDTCHLAADTLPAHRPLRAVQPIQLKLTQPIRSAIIPIEIPPGVEICSLSYAGLITDSWDFIQATIQPDSGFLVVGLINTTGDLIPVGTTTVFNIFFSTSTLCTLSQYIHWDTALSQDPQRHLLLGDSTNLVDVLCSFDPNRDSTEILGFQPGDANADGTGCNILDLTFLVDFIFRGGPRPCVTAAADINGSCTGPNIVDLTYCVDIIFRGGPPPKCACSAVALTESGKTAKALTVSAIYDNEFTTLWINSDVALRGLQLELAGQPTEPLNLVGNKLDIISGFVEETLRIGLLDLDGGNTLPSGNYAIVKLEGKYEVLYGLGSDINHQPVTMSLNGLASNGSQLPAVFALEQNYPNPFNPSTNISFSLPDAAEVTLEIYNVLGQKIVTLVNANYEAGEHIVEWDGRNAAGSAVSSGIYFYRLTAGTAVTSKKMMLLK